MTALDTIFANKSNASADVIVEIKVSFPITGNEGIALELLTEAYGLAASQITHTRVQRNASEAHKAGIRLGMIRAAFAVEDQHWLSLEDRTRLNDIIRGGND